MSHILLVEDDPEVRTSLTESLHELGHRVDSCGTGAGAVSRVWASRPDLVLLDLGLPDVDGATVLAMVRAVSPVPVIVVTARTEHREVIRLLDLGADDYVVKPFDALQLEARIRAVLRRTEPAKESVVQIGGLHIDDRARVVKLHGRPIELRSMEYQLLLALVHGAGTIIVRDDLIKQVWGSDARDGDRRLDNHLSVLRSKLGDNGRDQRIIRTVRGVGVTLDTQAPELR